MLSLIGRWKSPAGGHWVKLSFQLAVFSFQCRLDETGWMKRGGAQIPRMKRIFFKSQISNQQSQMERSDPGRALRAVIGGEVFSWQCSVFSAD